MLPRDNTKMWPLELSETPDTSPKYMLDGSRSGLGTESNAIEGTACCAKADGPINSNSPIHQCFMLSPQSARLLLSLEWMLVYRCSRRPSPAHVSRVITVRRPAHSAALEGMICYCVLGKPLASGYACHFNATRKQSPFCSRLQHCCSLHFRRTMLGPCIRTGSSGSWSRWPRGRDRCDCADSGAGDGEGSRRDRRYREQAGGGHHHR